MKLRKDMYLLSGGPYGQLGNVCLVAHAEGYLLVDAGNPNAYDTMLQNLHYWGVSPSEITHVLLTHGHDDHAGCAKAFQEQGAKIVVGNGDQQLLKQGNFGKESPYQNHWMPSCEADIIIDEDTTLSIGGLIVHAYTMPGHTDGSIVYCIQTSEDVLLCTGDMFYCEGEKGDQAFTGWKGDLHYNAHTLGQSFAKLWQLNLQPTIVCGGHGIPVFSARAKEAIMIAYKYYLLNNR